MKGRVRERISLRISIRVINSYYVFYIFYDNVSAIRCILFANDLMSVMFLSKLNLLEEANVDCRYPGHRSSFFVCIALSDKDIAQQKSNVTVVLV